MLKGRKLSDVHFKPLSRKEIVELYRRSKIILDSPMHIETGISMRIFEALGAGKKLITTNSNIAKEPFYDEENISIIDPDNLSLDVDFIRRPQSNWNHKIEDYSISNWVRKLFS